MEFLRADAEVEDAVHEVVEGLWAKVAYRIMAPHPDTLASQQCAEEAMRSIWTLAVIAEEEKHVDPGEVVLRPEGYKVEREPLRDEMDPFAPLRCRIQDDTNPSAHSRRLSYEDEPAYMAALDTMEKDILRRQLSQNPSSSSAQSSQGASTSGDKKELRRLGSHQSTPSGSPRAQLARQQQREALMARLDSYFAVLDKNQTGSISPAAVEAFVLMQPGTGHTKDVRKHLTDTYEIVGKAPVPRGKFLATMVALGKVYPTMDYCVCPVPLSANEASGKAMQEKRARLLEKLLHRHEQHRHPHRNHSTSSLAGDTGSSSRAGGRKGEKDDRSPSPPPVRFPAEQTVTSFTNIGNGNKKGKRGGRPYSSATDMPFSIQEPESEQQGREDATEDRRSHRRRSRPQTAPTVRVAKNKRGSARDASPEPTKTAAAPAPPTTVDVSDSVASAQSKRSSSSRRRRQGQESPKPQSDYEAIFVPPSMCDASSQGLVLVPGLTIEEHWSTGDVRKVSAPPSRPQTAGPDSAAMRLRPADASSFAGADQSRSLAFNGDGGSGIAASAMNTDRLHRRPQTGQDGGSKRMRQHTTHSRLVGVGSSYPEMYSYLREYERVNVHQEGSRSSYFPTTEEAFGLAASASTSGLPAHSASDHIGNGQISPAQDSVLTGGGMSEYHAIASNVPPHRKPPLSASTRRPPSTFAGHQHHNNDFHQGRVGGHQHSHSDSAHQDQHPHQQHHHHLDSARLRQLARPVQRSPSMARGLLLEDQAPTSYAPEEVERLTKQLHDKETHFLQRMPATASSGGEGSHPMSAHPGTAQRARPQSATPVGGKHRFR